MQAEDGKPGGALQHAKHEYPHTARRAVGQHYGREIVPDDYEWLEAPIGNPELQEWIAAQNAATENHLQNNDASRTDWHRLTEKLARIEQRGVPWKQGRRWLQFRKSAEQRQAVLHLLEAPDGASRILIDPEDFRREAPVFIYRASASPDGKLLAFGLQQAGSDWLEWRVLDIERGALLDDKVEKSRFSDAVWLPDSRGFLYQKFLAPDRPNEQGHPGEAVLALHVVDGDPKDDATIFVHPQEAGLYYSVHVVAGNRYVLVESRHGTSQTNELWIAPIVDGGIGTFKQITCEPSGNYHYVGSTDTSIYVISDAQAELGELLIMDPASGRFTGKAVPEGTERLHDAVVTGDSLLLLCVRHGAHVLYHRRTGQREFAEVTLPGPGSVELGKRASESAQPLFRFSSPFQPGSILSLAEESGEPVELWAPELPVELAHLEGTTVRQFAESADGTRVPCYISRASDCESPSPVLILGYGGFDYVLTPQFSVQAAAWLMAGGTYASANIRGGGEYGRAWHTAGTLEHKQNVFDDFRACAEMLTATGIAEPGQIAATGSSNGGLLVGACITLWPELFSAAHIDVGVLDMLRYHLFTVGSGWTGDYGSSDNPDQFDVLIRYSPLHNLREGICYPPTIVTTGDSDDRVVPAHSFKFTARMQYVQTCTNPVLLRVQQGAGHGHGKPADLLSRETADVLTFLWEAVSRRNDGDNRG